MSAELSTPKGTPTPDPKKRAAELANSVFANGLPMRQTRRAAMRTLALPPHTAPTLTSYEAGVATLASAIEAAGATADAEPMLVLLSDPTTTPAAEWQWQLQQPIRGPVQADALGDATIAHVASGAYVEVRVPGGLAGLADFYLYFFEQFLPRYKHTLARPVILHHLVGELDARHPERVDIQIAIPVVLSIEPEP